MPDLAKWAAGMIGLVSADRRAVLAWARIQDRPTSVVVVREGVDQAAQTVRIEYVPPQASDMPSETGQTLSQQVVVFGVREHPDMRVADTSLQVGDRFYYDGRWFDLTGVVEYPGEIQGFGEAQRFGP